MANHTKAPIALADPALPKVTQVEIIPPFALRIEDAAKYVGLHRHDIEGWLRDGDLKAVMVGRRRLVLRAELEVLLLERAS